MSASARTVLTMAIAGALGGCEWIAGIEDTTVVRDGGQPDQDAPAVPPADAGTSGPPDAAVQLACPEPCVADAVAEFAAEQGGATGAWLYVEETPGPFGTSYNEMAFGEWEGPPGWYGEGGGGELPVIVHCPSVPDHAGCNGVADKLLFETTEPGAHHPGLMWMAPMTAGTYRLSGDWRVPPGAPTDTPMTLLLVRSSRFDSVLYQRFSTRTTPAAFDLDIDVAPGDTIRLIAIAEDFSHVPLALSFYVSGAQGPGRCQIATHFEDGSGDPGNLFLNACAPQVFLDNRERDDTCLEPDPLCPATTTGASPPGVPGEARVFVAGASMEYLGEPNRYLGDWTVQFWAYLDGGEISTDETLLSDQDCATERGIGVHRSHFGSTTVSEIRFEALFEHPTLDRCATGPTVITASVEEDQWHFFRLTRSTATETMSLCIDGLQVGQVLIPGDADISATEPMWLGRNVNQAPAKFRGRLADLRVLDRALPCDMHSVSPLRTPAQPQAATR